jgi:hypothetical protein
VLDTAKTIPFRFTLSVIKQSARIPIGKALRARGHTVYKRIKISCLANTIRVYPKSMPIETMEELVVELKSTSDFVSNPDVHQRPYPNMGQGLVDNFIEVTPSGDGLDAECDEPIDMAGELVVYATSTTTETTVQVELTVN